MLKDIVGAITNTQKILIFQNRHSSYWTLIWIIYTTGNESISYLWSIKWLKNVDNFDVNSISGKNPISYILEVDLEYPDELHELHNNYLLAPEKFAIPYDLLSDYCKNIADKYGTKVGNVKRLIPNLGNKTNYVVYYRNLQFYLSLGIKLTKIYNNLKLKPLCSMKIHIDFNTEKRKYAVNSFEKDFSKVDD